MVGVVGVLFRYTLAPTCNVHGTHKRGVCSSSVGALLTGCNELDPYIFVFVVAII